MLLLQFNLNTANAQVYSSAISSGAGGTGRSSVEPGDVHFLNPAMQVHLQGRRLFFSNLQTKDQTEFVAVLSDNTRESLVPGSLGFWQKTAGKGADQIKEKDLSFSLAEFGGQRWAMGIAAHMIETELSDKSYRQNTADIGFAYNPNPQWGFGAVFYNVYESENIPKAFLRQGSLGLGATYIHQKFARYRLDFVSGSRYRLDEGKILGGVESYFNEWLVFRLGAGASFKGQEGLWSAGFGFDGPVFKLQYAYQDPQNVQKEGIHLVDLTIPF